MSEQAVDQIVKHLRVNAPPCRTAVEPLLPADKTNSFSGILPAPFTREAVNHFVQHEWARRLEDVMLRRSGWHYYQRWSVNAVEDVAGWMAESLGWSAAQRSAEVEAFCATARCAPAA
jgi:glycerol-3-phosphate dehydrogenase